jgi:hypothetical protein
MVGVPSQLLNTHARLTICHYRANWIGIKMAGYCRCLFTGLLSVKGALTGHSSEEFAPRDTIYSFCRSDWRYFEAS